MIHAEQPGKAASAVAQNFATRHAADKPGPVGPPCDNEVEATRGPKVRWWTAKVWNLARERRQTVTASSA